MTEERGPAARLCPRCGATVPLDASFCPNCGYAMSPPPPYPPPYPPPTYPPYPAAPGPTSTPVIGGVLILLSGIFHVISGLLTLLFGSALAELAGAFGLGGIVAFFGAIGIIFGAVAIVGGAFAIMRKMWWLAVIGGILAILAIGPGLFGSLLALLGLILVAISRREFYS